MRKKYVLKCETVSYDCICFSRRICLKESSRERLKSALYLRLKKRKTFFLEKKLEIFEKKISFGKCRVVPKNVKGGTFFDL